MDTNEVSDTLPGPDEAAALRVLVVEDDPELATQLQKWLGRLGYEARVVSDGPGALRETQASPPDVVLLDIGLPGLDGFQVAERVQKEMARTLPKVPLLIAVTGHGDEDDLRRSREAGIDLHLVKPLDPDQLHHVLRRFQKIIH